MNTAAAPAAQPEPLHGGGRAAGWRLAWLPVLALVLAGLLSLAPLHQRLAHALGDAGLRLTAPSLHHDGVVMVDIDEASLRLLEPRLGAWPYRRDVYALVIDYLREAGARLVVLDIVFSGARAGDEALARTIARRPDTVLAASAQALESGDDAGPQPAALAGLSLAATPQRPAVAWSQFTLPTPRLLAALPQPGSLGVISAPLDDDGVLRRLPLWHRAGDRLLPALPLAAWWLGQGAVDAADPMAVAARWPQDGQGQITLGLPRNADAAPTLAFPSLVADALGQTGGQATRAAVAGRAVFIGNSAAAIETVMTPLGRRSGLAVLAQSYGALAQGHWLRTGGTLAQGLLLALALLPAALTCRRGRPAARADLAAALLTALALLALGLAVLAAWGITLDLLPALSVLSIALLLSVAVDLRWMELNNRRLAAERAAAQAASQAKGLLVATLSHELRTPMNAVLGFAQLLESDGLAPLAPHQLARVREIRRGGQHLLDLINDQLDQAALEAGKLRLETGAVAVAEVVQDCLQLLQPLADRRGITLALAAPSAGPSPAWADARRLKQVLLNLLSNAIKYNRQQGQVRVAVGADGDSVRVDISDTGPGLSSNQQQRLFQRFDRLDAAASVGVEGSGLGLALCRQLVELMRGECGVQSRPGQGSTFWISLPAAPLSALPPPVEPLRPPPPPQASSALRAPGAARLLYVDDDPVNVMLMEAMLAAHWPAQFVSAMSGQAGLALARSERPDLVLLDIHMPDMDGHEVLRQLRSTPATRAIPVIAVSAGVFADDVRAGLAAGFTAYLAKPIELAALVDALDHALGRHPTAPGCLGTRPAGVD